MIMKGHKILLLLAAAGTLFLAGCQKTGVLGTGTGDGTIRFSASAAPGTKTVYGAYNNTNTNAATWQSIDWVNGDQIRIYSNAAVRRVGYEQGKTGQDLYYWADYKVTGAKAGSANTEAGWSTATLENLNDDGNGLGNGLMWPAGTTSAKFYAIYPAPAAAESPGNTLDGTKGTLAGTIPAEQALKDGKTDMSYAYMTAVGASAQPASDDKTNIKLNFYPAFTAFEISMKSDVEEADAVTLTKFELLVANDAPATAKALAGAFTVTYGGTTEADKTFTCTGDGQVITYTFPEGTKVSKANDLNFTVFALPQDLQYLMMRFTLADNTTRSLRLKYGKDVTIGGVSHAKGEYITFAACRKHRINGLVMPGNLFNFSMITLDPVADDWIEVPITSDTDNVPEATQFVVTGANNGRDTTSGDPAQSKIPGRDAKEYRQYWLFNNGATVHVTFKVLAPEGGTWSVVKAGANPDSFTVTIPDGQGGTTETLSGSIASKAQTGQAPQTTVVTLTITNAATTSDQAELILKTYVTDKDGVKYSIDSETQLYDLRGHHHFILNNQDIVK